MYLSGYPTYRPNFPQKCKNFDAFLTEAHLADDLYCHKLKLQFNEYLDDAISMALAADGKNNPFKKSAIVTNVVTKLR